jgi:hypothetical protein
MKRKRVRTGARSKKRKPGKKLKTKTFIKKRDVPSRQKIEFVSKNATPLDGMNSFLGLITNLNVENTVTNVGSLIIDNVSYGGKQKHIVRNGKKIELKDIPFNFAYVSNSLRECTEPTLLKINTGGLRKCKDHRIKEIEIFGSVDLEKLKFKEGEHVAISFELLYTQKEEVIKFIKNNPKVRFFCYQD